MTGCDASPGVKNVVSSGEIGFVDGDDLFNPVKISLFGGQFGVSVIRAGVVAGKLYDDIGP